MRRSEVRDREDSNRSEPQASKGSVHMLAWAYAAAAARLRLKSSGVHVAVQVNESDEPDDGGERQTYSEDVVFRRERACERDGWPGVGPRLCAVFVYELLLA